MSIQDYLKPIGTLATKTSLADADKIVVYPNDFPLSPVGAQVTTLSALETKMAAEALAAIEEVSDAVDALHPDIHLHATLIAKETDITAVTKIILAVPASLVGYSVTGLRLHTYDVVGETAVAGKVTVEGTDATLSAGIAAGAYSGSAGVPMAGYTELALDDEIRVVISAGSGGDGLDAIIDLSWFTPTTPTDPA